MINIRTYEGGIRASWKERCSWKHHQRIEVVTSDSSQMLTMWCKQCSVITFTQHWPERERCGWREVCARKDYRVWNGHNWLSLFLQTHTGDYAELIMMTLTFRHDKMISWWTWIWKHDEDGKTGLSGTQLFEEENMSSFIKSFVSSGFGVSHPVHAVLLHSEFSTISMWGLGHVVQLLLLQGGVLCWHCLTQMVDTRPRKDKVRRQTWGFLCCLIPMEKWFVSSLYVLLMSRASHRLGPPALLLLRHIVLQTQKTRLNGKERMGIKQKKNNWMRKKAPQNQGLSPSRLLLHLQPHWPTVLLPPSTSLLNLKKDRKKQSFCL